MEHLDGCHESADTDTIILCTANFSRLIVNGVEFTDFVAVTDGFKQGFDVLTVAWQLEVLFLDSNLSVS